VTSGAGSRHLYLELGEVLELYAEIFGCTVREADDQLRDAHGLEGALGRPAHYAYYKGADLALLAAVLAHGIAEGQHFIEGNKRTALAAMRTFLLINGFGVSASQEERARWMLDLSEGLTPEELAAELRRFLVPAAAPPTRG
jgi:death-on-curing protein